MNERIKEPYYSLMYKDSQGWNDHLFQIPPELLEKFAESIVRECAKICANTAVADPPNDLLEGYNLGVNKAAENIKKHFGVEE